MNDRADLHPAAELPALLRGELDAEAAADVGRHLARCSQCREDLLSIATAASALEDLGRVSPAPLPPLRLPPRREVVGVRRWAAIGAAAVLVVVLVAGLAGFLLLRGGFAPPSGPTATVQLVPAHGSGAGGEAQMLGSGESQHMRIVTHGLEPAPAGAYYEVWLTSPTQALPVGILQTESGTFALPAHLTKGYSAVEVRLQPVAGNGGEPGETVLRGPL